MIVINYGIMKVWDYKLKKGWKPKTDEAWIWYLERKINYGDFKGLQVAVIRKFLNRVHIDPGKRAVLNAYFEKYGAH